METKKLTRGIGAFIGSILVVGLGAMPAFGDIIYDDWAFGDYNGGPEVTSYASAGNGASSFGSLITPNSTGAYNNVDLMMSNYATASQYSAAPGSSYNVNMELTVYQVNPAAVGTGTTPDNIFAIPGDVTQVATDTQSFAINYRPEADVSAIPGGCGGGNSNAYLVSANVYSCGQLNALDFNMSGVLTQGTDYIWVASILSGSDPAAQSLNWAINNLTSNICPTATAGCPAINPQYDTNYVNGIGGTGWGSIGQGEINFAPEPATLGLIGLGLLGIGVSVRGKSRKS